MRKLIIIIAVFFIIAPASPAEADVIYIEDGGSHVVNDSTYQDSHVHLDWNIVNDPGTHFELADGGTVKALLAGNNSTVQISGGTISFNLQAHNNSTVMVSGGTVGSYCHAIDNGIVTISGGVFNGPIVSNDSGTINVSGGTINDYFSAYDGTIYLYGSSFSVGDVELSLGESLRGYGVLDEYGYWLGGTITGTLLDSSLLNNGFYIWADTDADIIIVPEPATLLLLGLGVVVLRKYGQ